jgi:hypothetical protein
MRIVTLTKDMRPWQKGEDAVLPEPLAAKLIADGDAENERPYPPPDVAPAKSNVAPERPVLQPKRYFTRKRG